MNESKNAGFNRREFIKTASAASVALGSLGGLSSRLLGEESTKAAAAASPETNVKTLFGTLTDEQKKVMCFDWDYVDPKRGLLRSRVANNWQITDETVNGGFYTDDQRDLIRAIFDASINSDWQDRFEKQLEDDNGGFGENNSIAIFGKPGDGKFEFVLTGRHMTLRCDGNSTDHVAFGGPIFYGHAAEGFNESPNHKGNVFWEQGLLANGLYTMMDGKQRKLALVKKGLPRESSVAFKGAEGKFQGIPVTEFTADQKEHLQKVVDLLVEPYRKTDRDETLECLKKQGGLDVCHLAFYQEGNLGKDEVWDNWRLEGPSFVWHFRGSPHVHVWGYVADDAKVKLNAQPA